MYEGSMMPDWLQDLLNYGPLGIITLAVILFTWRAGTWAAPFLKKFFEANIALIESLKNNQEKQTALLEGLQDNQRNTTHLLRSSQTQLESIHSVLDEQKTVLEMQASTLQVVAEAVVKGSEEESTDQQ